MRILNTDNNHNNHQDFLPLVEVDGQLLPVVSQSKVLGIILQNSLKWNSHVENICERARKKFFILINMINLKLDYQIILDIYLKEIRPILEYGAVIFHSGLTQVLSNDIETIQRNILKILSKYINQQFSYTEACIFFQVDFLFSRRSDLCFSFVKRYLKEHGDGKLFTKRNKRTLRGNNKIFREPKYKSQRFYNSPVNYLTRVANEVAGKKNKNKTKGS